MKKRTEGSDTERGRQERKGQAHAAFVWASRDLQGRSGPSPTQPFGHRGHISSTLLSGTGCSLLSRLPVPEVDSLTLGKFCAHRAEILPFRNHGILDQSIPCFTQLSPAILSLLSSQLVMSSSVPIPSHHDFPALSTHHTLLLNKFSFRGVRKKGWDHFLIICLCHFISAGNTNTT